MKLWWFGLVSLVGIACGSNSGFVPDAGGDGGIGFGDGAGTSSACQAANDAHASIGCDYYAIHMDGGWSSDNGCFVAFLANTSNNVVRVKATFQGLDIDLTQHAVLPHGTGKKLTLDPFDPGGVGLPPGEVGILFLAGPVGVGGKPQTMSDPVQCPVAPAFNSLTQIHGTGKGAAFHIQTSDPVVAYQMLPYGGGDAAVTGATLLLPTSVYGTNYIAVDAYQASATTGAASTSMNLVASQDNTTITILPNVDILAGGGVAPAKANVQAKYTLNAGEQLQFSQPFELT
ncbi:MAG TPA: hypothetical protein VGH87_09575, partial [Polyangiaceae bacterium]